MFSSKLEVVYGALASDEYTQREEDAGEAQRPVHAGVPLLDEPGLEYKKRKPEPAAGGMDY